MPPIFLSMRKKTSILIVNYLLKEIVMHYPRVKIPERLLEKYTRRQQELITREVKLQMARNGYTKEELKKYNYWNLPDAERIDLIRKKMLAIFQIDSVDDMDELLSFSPQNQSLKDRASVEDRR